MVRSQRYSWGLMLVLLLACLLVRSTAFQPGANGSSERLKAMDEDSVPNGRDLVAVREDRSRQNSSGDTECLLDPPSKHIARDRAPPFPQSAYSNLAREEEQLSFNYISFIDQSILRTYSQQTQMVEPRRYALPNQFESKNINVPPTIDDVAMPRTNYGPIAVYFGWSGLPARAVVGSASYLAFPFLINFLYSTISGGIDIDMLELSKLVDSFLPGVGVVLGTYFSLTISILYDRLTKLTEAANAEAAQLSLTLVNLLHLFEDSDPEAAVEGSQCIADQVRTLVYDSRGKEAAGVIYNDPYARMLRLLKDYSNTDACNSLVQDGYLLADLHGNVGKLFQFRANRLTLESLALAPTHFDVMTFLSGLLLAGFALGTVATAADAGVPSETARVLFAALVVCYTIFYEMAFDLNRPFDGIYQLRRSGVAMHLLQIKQIISTNPVVKGLVDFEAIPDDGDATISGECTNCNEKRERIWYN